jgi:septal ring factor EnvC (AmiA/AmiB activator)
MVLNKDKENLSKKNQIDILEIESPFRPTKNTVEGYFSRLEQVGDRISEIEHKIAIKEKNRRNLSQTTQELRDSIKKQNMRIISIAE